MGLPVDPMSLAQRVVADRQQNPLTLAQGIVIESGPAPAPQAVRAPLTTSEAFVGRFFNSIAFGLPEALGMELRDPEGLAQTAAAAVGELAGFIGGPIKIFKATIGRVAVPLAQKIFFRGGRKLPVLGKALSEIGPRSANTLNNMIESTTVLGGASVLREAGPIALHDAPILDPLLSGALMGLAFGSAGSIKNIWKRIPIMSSITSVPTAISGADLEEVLVQAGLGVYFGLHGGVPKQVEIAQARRNLANKIRRNNPEISLEDAQKTAEETMDGLNRYLRMVNEEIPGEAQRSVPAWLQLQQDAFMKVLNTIGEGEAAPTILRNMERNAQPLGTFKELPEPEQGFVTSGGIEQRTRGTVAPVRPAQEVDPREGIASTILEIDRQLARTRKPETIQAGQIRRTELAVEHQRLTEQHIIDTLKSSLVEYDPRSFEERLRNEQFTMEGEAAPGEAERFLAQRLQTEEIIPVTNEPEIRFASELLSRLGFSEAGGVIKDDESLQLKLGALSGRGQEPRALQMPDGTYRIFAREGVEAAPTKPTTIPEAAEEAPSGAERAPEKPVEARPEVEAAPTTPPEEVVAPEATEVEVSLAARGERERTEALIREAERLEEVGDLDKGTAERMRNGDEAVAEVEARGEEPAERRMPDTELAMRIDRLREEFVEGDFENFSEDTGVVNRRIERVEDPESEGDFVWKLKEPKNREEAEMLLADELEALNFAKGQVERELGRAELEALRRLQDPDYVKLPPLEGAETVEVFDVEPEHALGGEERPVGDPDPDQRRGETARPGRGTEEAAGGELPEQAGPVAGEPGGRAPLEVRNEIIMDPKAARFIHEGNFTPYEEAFAADRATSMFQDFWSKYGLEWGKAESPEFPDQAVPVVRFGKVDRAADLRVWPEKSFPDAMPEEMRTWIQREQRDAVTEIGERAIQENYVELNIPTERAWELFLKDVKDGKYKDSEMIVVPEWSAAGYTRAAFIRQPEAAPEAQKRSKVNTEPAPGEKKSTYTPPKAPNLKVVGQGEGQLKKFPPSSGRIERDFFNTEGMVDVGEGFSEAAAVIDQHGRLWLPARGEIIAGAGWVPWKPGSWLNGPFFAFGESRGFMVEEQAKLRLIDRAEWNAREKELKSADTALEKVQVAGFTAEDRAGDIHPKRSKFIEGVGKTIRRFASPDQTRPALQQAYIEGNTIVATDGHGLAVIRGVNLLPKGVRRGWVDAENFRNKDYRIYQDVEGGVGPYPDYRRVMPTDIDSFHRVGVEQLIDSIKESGADLKGRGTAVGDNEVYAILYDLAPLGKPGERAMLIKRKAATGKEDLHNAEWVTFDARNLLRAAESARDLGMETIDFGLGGAVSASLLKGRPQKGVSAEFVVMPLRPGELPLREERGASRPKIEKLMADIGEAQIRLAEALESGEGVAAAEKRLETVQNAARKAGVSGIVPVESSLGAARRASSKQNRLARVLQKELELSEADYVALKREITGKEHMLDKEDGAIQGMFSEEASRVIGALSAKLTARNIERGMEGFEAATPKDFSNIREEEIQEMLKFFDLEDGEYPDITDTRGIGILSWLRPVRHVAKNVEKVIRGAYSILFKPPHDASIGAFEHSREEIRNLIKNVDKEVLNSKESSKKVDDILRIGEETGDNSFQERLMAAGEEDVGRISVELDATPGEVRAAKYLRQRYEFMRTFFGTKGLDIGYVFGYSPRVATSYDYEAMNLGYPRGVPDKITAFMEKERTGELERRKDDAFELFASYLRKGYKAAYLKRPIELAREFLDQLDIHGRAAERIVGRLAGSGQADMLSSEIIHVGEQAVPNAVLFAARQNRHTDAIRKFYETYYQRLLGHPSQLDHRFAETIRGFARGTGLDKVLAKGGVDIENDAFVMKTADFMIRLGYLGGLGFRPLSAVKNLTQMNNTIGDIGFQWWAKGMAEAMNTKQIMADGREVGSFEYLRDVGVLKEFAPEYYREISLRKTGMRGLQDVSMGMFQWADAVNRMGSYFGARAKFNYYLAQFRAGDITKNDFLKRAGVLGEDEIIQKDILWQLFKGTTDGDFEAAHKFATNVTGRTQYLYNKEDAPLIGTSAIGRIGWQYQTWWENYIEMHWNWAQNKQWQKFGRWAVSSIIMAAVLEEFGRMGLEGLKPENVLFAGPLPTRRTEFGQIAPPIAPVAQLGLDFIGGPFALVKDLQAGNEQALKTFVRTMSRDFDIFIPGHSTFRDISPVFFGERTSASRELTNALFPKKKTTTSRRSRSRRGRSR